MLVEVEEVPKRVLVLEPEVLAAAVMVLHQEMEAQELQTLVVAVVVPIIPVAQFPVMVVTEVKAL
jgi:hypothetical protein